MTHACALLTPRPKAAHDSCMMRAAAAVLWVSCNSLFKALAGCIHIRHCQANVSKALGLRVAAVVALELRVRLCTPVVGQLQQHTGGGGDNQCSAATWRVAAGRSEKDYRLALPSCRLSCRQHGDAGCQDPATRAEL